jgi:hypothetical protein
VVTEDIRELNYNELSREVQNGIEWHAHDCGGMTIKEAMIDLIRKGIESE